MRVDLLLLVVLMALPACSPPSPDVSYHFDEDEHGPALTNPCTLDEAEAHDREVIRYYIEQANPGLGHEADRFEIHCECSDDEPNWQFLCTSTHPLAGEGTSVITPAEGAVCARGAAPLSCDPNWGAHGPE